MTKKIIISTILTLLFSINIKAQNSNTNATIVRAKAQEYTYYQISPQNVFTASATIEVIILDDNSIKFIVDDDEKMWNHSYYFSKTKTEKHTITYYANYAVFEINFDTQDVAVYFSSYVVTFHSTTTIPSPFINYR